MSQTGVAFGTVHSLRDWHATLADADLGMPSVKTSTIDIPGADGVLDLTEALSGTVRYGNRTLKFRFEARESEIADWASWLRGIVQAVHGRRLDMVLDEDAGWTWSGRCEVSDFNRSGGKLSFAVTCDCDPYRTNAAGERSL